MEEQKSPFCYETGSLFYGNHEAIVNPVNCVGVMGKGLALAFKQRYPENFQEYAVACKEKKVKIGQMFITQPPKGTPKYIINFPTKIHWVNGSEYEWIKRGLVDLRMVALGLKIKSIGIPRLGCSNGGLDWEVVRFMIEKELKDLTDVDICIYL